MINNKQIGVSCALLAAIFNSLIGIFSVNIINIGMGPYAVAFYKCLIGLIIVTTWLLFSKQLKRWYNFIRKFWWQLPLIAFFGIFVLYFFETSAYNHEKVTVVVFMLLGSATITTFVLSSILNKQIPHRHDFYSCICAIIGLGLIFGVSANVNANYAGVLLALIAGIGYGIFLISSKKFNIGSGLIVVNSLMLFGTLFLSIPFAYEGIVKIPNLMALTQLLLLALLPTIGGFWFTTKAVSILKGESVQLLELSEPIFSLIFSFLFLHQVLGNWQLIGGVAIVFSIFIHMRTT